MKDLTLKQYLLINDLNYEDVKTVSPGTIGNIIKGKHNSAKYNEKCKGEIPYYPSDKTMERLSKGLKLTAEEVKILVDNQFESIKKDL